MPILNSSMLASLVNLILVQLMFIQTSTPTKTEPCTDLFAKNVCRASAKYGYCTHFKVLGNIYCKKTCGNCPDPPTANPTQVNNTTDICGKRTSTPKHRIVGGKVSRVNAWPWMAQLAFVSNGFVFCGGTLISSQWVVTAAHCVSGYLTNPSAIKIRLGAHYRDISITTGNEQSFTLSKIISHPRYNKPLGLSNDIALLKLSRPASINTKVGPACVPTEKSPSGFQPPKKCYVTGWGHLVIFGHFSDQLMQAELPIQSNTTCRTAYPGLVDKSMVCAGPSQGGVDACQGDSGGPLVCSYGNRWYLEGVVSWGHGCASKGKYGVYSKVRHFNSWIQKTMKIY